jgi:hypothetical protein
VLQSISDHLITSAGKPFLKGRVSTIDLRVLTSLKQIIQTLFTLYKTRGGQMYSGFPLQLVFPDLSHR